MTLLQKLQNQETTLQSNRNPFPYEEVFRKEEKELNEAWIQMLEAQLKERMTRARDAVANTHQKALNRAAAEMRLEAAQDLRDSLIETQSRLSQASPMIRKNYEDLMGYDGDGVKTNLNGLADVLMQWENSQAVTMSQLKQISDAVQTAKYALVHSLEEQQEALAREEQSVAMVEAIKQHIQEIKQICNKRSSRAMWRVPASVWRIIFSEVIWDNVDPDEIENSYNAVSFPPLSLSAVCQLWRSVAQQHQSLWSTIQFVVNKDQDTDIMLERIQHYLDLSVNRPLRIVVEVQPTMSSPHKEVLAKVVSRPNPVDHLTVRGGVKGKEVIGLIWTTIKPPKKITIGFSGEGAFHGLLLSSTMTKNLQHLKLKDCAPMALFNAGRGTWTSSIVTLQLFNSSMEESPWSLFYTWIFPQISQLESIVLDTKFTNTDPIESIKKTSFRQLKSIRTNLATVLLLHRSLVHTPVLRSLVIIDAKETDLPSWREFASSETGGANITSVTVEHKDSTDWALLARCLHHLPRLQTLEVYGAAVSPLLKPLTAEQATDTDGPSDNSQGYLKALEVVSVIDCEGTGEDVLSFVLPYVPVRAEEPSSEPVADDGNRGVPRVLFKNCPNVTNHVLQMLQEIGCIPSNSPELASPRISSAADATV